jgi:hypothetical protein
MKLLQVNYRREHGQDDAGQAEHRLAAAERIAGLPGGPVAATQQV